jgi:phenylalanine-4-hydroxylase
MRESGRLKAYGAGLLSSIGEIHRVELDPALRPLDVAEMVSTPYDITRFQETLFVADSLDHLEDVLGGLLDGYGDEVAAQLSATVTATGAAA